MKLLVFGIGNYYKCRKEYLFSCLDGDEIIAFLDNRAELNTMCDAKPVYLPRYINRIDYDGILLMSDSYREMREQLLSLGVSTDKIFFFEQYICEKSHGKLQVYVGGMPRDGKRILLLTNALGYHGGAIALTYAAKALLQEGFDVLLAAASGDRAFINEIVAWGLNVLICPSIPYIKKEEWLWIYRFDVVLVNVFPMLQAACEISKRKPVIWWIHEAENIYESIIYRYAKYATSDAMKSSCIVAVSNIAKQKFETYFPGMVKGLLHYGIPDRYSSIMREQKNFFIFALIGRIAPVKAQDVFLRAISKIPEPYRERMKFWLIGAFDSSAYGKNVLQIASGISQVSLLGNKERREVEELFSDIDVLVCSSHSDSMPIVVAEGMMSRKVCIVSDAVGSTKYMKNGENGFVFEDGNTEELSRLMVYAYLHQNELDFMRENARITYKKIFSMNVFSSRLKNLILQVENDFSSRME